MARKKSAENATDPATGRPLPQGVQYRGPLQYRCRPLIDGKRVTKTFDSAKLAKQWLEDTSSKAREGTYVDRSPLDQWTIKRLVEKFRDEVLVDGGDRRGAAEDRAHIPSILEDEELAGLKLSKVSSYDIQDFRDRQLAEGYAKSTVAKRMNLLQQAFGKAISSWRIPMPSNPASGDVAKRPKGADKKRDRVLFIPGPWEREEAVKRGEDELPTEEEVLLGALAKSIYPHDVQITRFAIGQAARQGECLGLRWRDVDLNRRTVTIHGRQGLGDKGDDYREVITHEKRALMPMAHAVLTEMKEEGITPGDLIFKVGGYRAFRVRWGRIVAKTGAGMTGYKEELGYLQGLKFHDLRHESTTRLSEFFPRNADLMDVTGHRDLRSMKRYYNTRPEQLAAQAEAMLRAIEAKTKAGAPSGDNEPLEQSRK